MTTTPDSRPLAGLRIVEVSSFVASPLCGLTLAQLGAEVTRVDPIGGAADIGRLPTTAEGTSIYWTGLNKGKRSVVADLRSAEGQRIVQDLVTAPGEGGGILVTNQAGREWLSHDTLSQLRSDVVTVEILGRRDGRPGVDYTVNAALGFPQITGPREHAGVVNHALPAWDVACGLYAALAVTSAVRRRERTGLGSHVTLPLDDVALSIASTLGYLTEPQVNGAERDATGNDVYGTYGTDFVTADGGRFMIVALTPRHFRDLVSVTGTHDAVAAVEKALGADFARDEDRYRHREILTALFSPWFRERSTDDVRTALAETAVLHEQYRGFAEVAAGDAVTANPLFAQLDQPGIGTYLAAGLPAAFDGEHYFTGPAVDPASVRQAPAAQNAGESGSVS
ncbi:2-methylfumaryl-CoA isomerase [Rhodococcus rhodnii]|uniref:Formyl-coenzyme A transferase n=2 Tax=Rhodococcus rhodnii TaxID=38312 RepID=R7WJ48_9NOCA|nr:CoA transferase [Rhodococcus rhodnii]EOM75290.1 formyl-coenzyme A transferase [Rhodococcus rhodnii LMG 5362]TXG92480.1 2-methylfumaryl-CoA isomerase [Rhodococcus rhodnii]